MAQCSRLFNRFTKIAALLLIGVMSHATASAANRQQMHGHRNAAMTAAPMIDDVNSAQVVDLAFSLPLRDQAGLAALLAAISDPKSPQYRHYLSPEEFASRFGPSAADYAKLKAFALARGLSVTGEHSNHTILDVRMNAAQVENVLHTRLRHYRRHDGSSFFGPDAEPSLDLELPLLHISGLDDFNPPHPHFTVQPMPKATGPSPYAGSGPGGLLSGNDFRSAYAPGVALNGAGQSVALLEFDTYYPGDLSLYRGTTGLSTPVENVFLNGWSSSTTPGGGNGEVTLDIEMAMAMAPGLNSVIVYMGNNIMDVLNRIATENRAKQISSSWGWGPSNPTELQIEQQYAAQGQSYFNASGDSGAFSSDPGGNEDDPMQTLVGGTNLSLNGTGGSYASESAWSGSTGGILSNVGIPSYQQGISMANNHGSTTSRNAPDIAAAASGILLYANNGQTINVGGTSCAAPLWAGFTALVNQQAAAAGKPAVGFMNAALYNLGKGANFNADFHDITTGNNGSPNFPAVAGYDLVTGWGSPKGQPLINDLAQAGPPSSSTWRINAGGPGYTDSANQAWSADTAFIGGASNGNGNAIAGTSDASLYQSEHWGTSFSYNLNVPAGSYQVSLKFAEIFDGAAGQRLMNISINGTQVLANFDVLADAGGANKADDKVFSNIAPNASGQIVIQFASSSTSPDQNAKVNAIQVIPMPPTPTSTSTATKTKTSTSTATNTATRTNSPTQTWTSSSTATFTHTSTVTLTPDFSPTATPVIASVWRVNAGGPALTDNAGNAWSADTNFVGGGSNGNANAIAGTADPALYQSERWGSFSYAFNVPAGAYQLSLKFAEIFDGAAGQRVMNVSVNGSVVLANFDVFADAGANQADDKVLANVSPNAGGQIVIQFSPLAGSPDQNTKVSAIQIIPQPQASATPTWTLSSTQTSSKTNTPQPTATGTPTKTSTPVPPTATFTYTPTKTSTPVLPSTAIQLNYRNPDLGDLSGSPHPQFGLWNQGNSPIQLTDFEIRYWLSCDCNGSAMQAWLDWSSIPGTLVDLVAVSRGTQTHYLRVRFSAAYSLQPNAIAEVQTRFNKADWSNLSQANDYSFVSQGAYYPDNKVTVYQAGALVWGIEPALSTASSADRAAGGGPKDGLSLPGGKLLIAGPNPALSSATLNFALQAKGRVKILLSTFTDIVISKDLGTLGEGIYEEKLALNGLASGIYLVHLLVDQGSGYKEAAMFKLVKKNQN